MFIHEISVDDLVDPLQIAWISYREGDAVIKVKVIRDKGSVFLSHPTCFRKGTQVDVVTYIDKEIWYFKAKTLLAEFKRAVGNGYYRYGHGKHINRTELSRERL